MSRTIRLSVVPLVLCAVSAWAGCGTCGSGEEKGGANCGTGTCAVASDVKVQAKGACCAEQAGVINTAGVAALLNSKTTVVVLDARSGKFDDGKRLPGAKSLNAQSTDEAIKSLLPDKNALVVTYCAGLKCPASKMLADKLRKAGYANVVEYSEGIEGWLKAGNAVENAK